MTKQEIRKNYVGLREALSKSEIDKSSQEIAAIFFSLVDFSQINVIHIFLPIVSKKEIDTWLIIAGLRKKHPHIKISIPKVEGEQLVNFYFVDKNQLIENQWKIIEPS